MADAWLSEFNTSTEVAPIRFSTESDTFRGGAQLVVVREGIRNTERDRPLTSLPSSWTTSGQVSFDSRGALLKSLSTPATLTTSDSNYAYFDVSVDVTPLSPPDTSATTELIACLEHEVGGEIARVCIVRGATADPSKLYAIGEAFTGDVTAGAQLAPAGRITLRLIRNGPKIWGYVGVRPSVAQPDEFSVLLKVLDTSVEALGALGGVIRLASRSSSRATSAIFSNYTVRSQVTINNRPLVNKRTPTNRQLVGFVPAATIRELGPAVVSVFGLFGSVTDSGVFSYTLPAAKTVGNEITRTLRSYQDPVIRDLVTGD